MGTAHCTSTLLVLPPAANPAATEPGGSAVTLVSQTAPDYRCPVSRWRWSATIMLEEFPRDNIVEGLKPFK